MKKEINQLIKSAIEAIKQVDSLDTLEKKRIEYLGKKGQLTQMMSQIKDLPNDQKPSFGKWINEAKVSIEAALYTRKQALEDDKLITQLASETLDPTLPGYEFKKGRIHPLNKVIEDLEDYFIGQGFNVAEGPELELDHYNFEMMNLEKGHPARDMHDSFYINDELLLRTHTSPVQARYMLDAKGKPVAIISPGKTYRRDHDDATHSHQFMQIEGLVIGEDVSFASLKETLLLMAKHLFGEDRTIRLRPSFFPFTEPSVEVDVSYQKKDGTTGWIEVLGAGMVHPNVLEMAGYDASKSSGFAFGIGVERIAILKHDIDDIRYFYQNDIRFLKQFKGV